MAIFAHILAIESVTNCGLNLCVIVRTVVRPTAHPVIDLNVNEGAVITIRNSDAILGVQLGLVVSIDSIIDRTWVTDDSRSSTWRCMESTKSHTDRISSTGVAVDIHDSTGNRSGSWAMLLTTFRGEATLGVSCSINIDSPLLLLAGGGRPISTGCTLPSCESHAKTTSSRTSGFSPPLTRRLNELARRTISSPSSE